MTPLAAILLFALPAAVAAGGFLVVELLGARSEREADARASLAWRLAPPMVFVAAFLPADFGLNHAHPIWDKDGTKRFLAVVLAAGLVGAIHAAVGRAVATGILRAILGAGTAFIVLLPLAGGTYLPWPLLLGLATAAALWLPTTGGVLDRADESLPRLTVPVVLLVTAAASAPGLFACGYAGGAMLAGTLGAAAFGLSISRATTRQRPVAIAGGNTVCLALLAAILLVTFGYNDVPAWWVLPIMAAAPLAALAGLLPDCPMRGFAAAVLAAGMLAGGATLASTLAATDDQEESYDGY